MKVKLDENLPRALAELLRANGHDTSTVAEENLRGAADPSILRRATSEGRLLMTFDTDFADIREYPPVTHRGITAFRLHDQRWAMLRHPAQRLLESGLLDALRGGLAVADETRVRIRAGRTRQE